MPDPETIIVGAQVNTVTPEVKTEIPVIPVIPVTKPPEIEAETLIGAAGKETETKTEETKTEEVKKVETPGEYTDFTLPEGIPADAEIMTEFKATAKEFGLTQEQAQKLVDIQTKSLQAGAKAADDGFNSLTNEWMEDTKKAYGANLPKELAFVAKARDEFAKADPEAAKDLMETLTTTRLGSYLSLVKFFSFFGRKVSEDSFETGPKATGGMDAARTMFPSMK